MGCTRRRATRFHRFEMESSLVRNSLTAIIDTMDDEKQRRDDARSLRNLLVAGALVLTFPIWGTLFFYLLNAWARR